MNKKVLTGVALLLLIIGFWVVVQFNSSDNMKVVEPTEVSTAVEKIETVATSSVSVLGTSIEGRPIETYVFGSGETNILFVGGIHGGYEWNSSLLAYEMIDYWHANSAGIPDGITIHIIPNLNPDGLFLATGLEGRFVATDIPNNDMHTSGVGRFNANNIDLNRNFDCRFAPKSSWRGNVVEAGSAPFSEPEAAALRDYVAIINPAAAIFWHSQAGNVYGSECGNAVTSETLALMATYANASGYGKVPVFDAYVVTGAAEDWLASLGVPTVSVELKTRTSIEWEKNLAGTNAVLQQYGK